MNYLRLKIKIENKNPNRLPNENIYIFKEGHTMKLAFSLLYMQASMFLMIYENIA